MYMILRLPQVQKKTGLAKSTIYKKISAREFPKPIPLGAKAVGWIEEDINKWIEECVKKAANNNQHCLGSFRRGNDNDNGGIRTAGLEGNLWENI